MLRPLIALPLLTLATPAAAQQDFSDVEITVEAGEAGRCRAVRARRQYRGSSHGPDGTILIDDQYAPLSQRIMAALDGRGRERGALPRQHALGISTIRAGNENFGRGPAR